MPIVGEIWRDVVGYEGLYQVSNLGRVKSVTRVVRSTAPKTWVYSRTVKGCLCNVFAAQDGRTHVNLSKNNHNKAHRVCRLVLLAFVGPCPEGMEACHFPDRNPANNRLDNLRWDTRSGNMRDCKAHGTLVIPGLKGEDIARAKIKNAQICVIHEKVDKEKLDAIKEIRTKIIKQIKETGEADEQDQEELTKLIEETGYAEELGSLDDYDM